MKQILKKAWLIAALMIPVAVQAQDEIVLQAPNMNRGTSLMQALQDRQSLRECNGEELSLADLSDLLWAANGINRPSEGKRTAPSAMNKQDVDIYVVMAKGTYLYDAKASKLTLVAEGDHRGSVAGRQESVKNFPVILVMVSDIARFPFKNDRTELMGALDAGYVSQNICLFCAANGLVTVPRGTMDFDQLRKILKLTDSQILMINNPVGYKK